MLRADHQRIDPKRRNVLDPKKRQFAQSTWKEQEYNHRLNFYILPPTAEISLEEFEEYAINRLKSELYRPYLLVVHHTNLPMQVLSELETCTFRNRTPEETQTYMTPLLQKYLPLQSNSSRSTTLQEERRRDHYSHFILRLAFSATEDLRRRFSRLETMLFRLRYKLDDARERNDFVKSLDFVWETVSAEEKEKLGDALKAATGSAWKKEDEDYFKVEWERVPELVEQRKVYLSKGMAYVPTREQMTLVLSEFTKKLDAALEVHRFSPTPPICLLIAKTVDSSRAPSS